ncbi:TPA: hypothetical protein ACX96Z_000478 [Clostridium sporogenes]
MNIEDIEVEVIGGENISKKFTEAILKLYKNNASKILCLDLEELGKKK